MPYDSIAASLFRSHKPPYDNLKVHVADLGKNIYSVRLYRHNLSEFSDSQQTVIAEWLDDVLVDMNKLSDLRMVYDIHE